MTETTEDLRQHELIILRRLRKHPLTEFELAIEVANNTGFNNDEATERMESWLDALRAAGLVWAGQLYNAEGQSIRAAALTNKGRKLVG